MSNQLSAQTSLTANVDGFRNTLSSNQNANTTSSNLIAQSVTVYGNVYTSLSTGVLTDVRYASFYNDSAVYSASIITVSGSGTAGPIGTVLSPGDQAVVPYSGSISTLSAKVTSTFPVGSGATLTGSIQYILSQS